MTETKWLIWGLEQYRFVTKETRSRWTKTKAKARRFTLKEAAEWLRVNEVDTGPCILESIEVRAAQNCATSE